MLGWSYSRDIKMYAVDLGLEGRLTQPSLLTCKVLLSLMAHFSLVSASGQEIVMQNWYQYLYNFFLFLTTIVS